MRFAHRLSSHLTPEWRKYYVDYEGLKARVYEMITKKKPETEEEDEDVRPITIVNEELQDEFFVETKKELRGVDSFYRTRETQSSLRMRELCEEVEIFIALKANKRTRNLRSTRNKLESLKNAVTEFYLSLSLLQNFQQLNYSGFRKVLKKHDKLACSDRGKRFLNDEVCESHFWRCKKILNDLIEQTENLMIDKLENGNRSKAMNKLRLPSFEKREVRSHWVTLVVGILLGFICVSVVVITVAAALRPRDSWKYLDPTIRGLRIGFILTLWFCSFAFNTFRWVKAGVNRVLIFEFNPRDYLNFVQLFQIAFLIGTVFIIGSYLTVFSHWLCIKEVCLPEWVGPLAMLVILALLFVLPLPFLYASSRFWLAKIISGRIFFAPFVRVNFADFWIADQMNSLSVVLLDLEFFFRFLVFGLLLPDLSTIVAYAVRPVVAVLPAWYRFAQCVNRYYVTKPRNIFPHLVNAGKYSTSFFVVLFSSLAAGFKDPSVDFHSQPGRYYAMFFFWIVSAIVSTCYTFTWDIKMDWGLFPTPKKLRDELIYPKKIYYILAIVADLILRSLWTLNISVGEAGISSLEGNLLGTILATLEVFRRFIWNFFRLENEHLNNCGQFRVVRDIAIYPINPTEVPLDDEEGQEPALKKHMTAQRKLSRQLLELSGSGGSVLRQRHRLHTVEEVDREEDEVKEADFPNEAETETAMDNNDNDYVVAATNKMAVELEQTGHNSPTHSP